MTLEQARELFEEIAEICYQTENQQLIDTVNQIYPEIEEAESVSKIVLSVEELQVVINVINFLDEEEDDVQEIQEIIEKLSE
jgi:hypothetical protein